VLLLLLPTCSFLKTHNSVHRRLGLQDRPDVKKAWGNQHALGVILDAERKSADPPRPSHASGGGSFGPTAPSVSPPPPDRKKVHFESPSPPPSDDYWRRSAHELFKCVPSAFSPHRSVMQNLASGEALAEQAAQHLARAKESAVASLGLVQFAHHISETCAQLQLKLDAIPGYYITHHSILLFTHGCSARRASTCLS
jgi:hypothetical protein